MSAKLTALAQFAGGQIPADLMYIVDVSAGAGGSLSSTLDDLFSIITRNITDGAVRFQGFAAPVVSGAGEGAIYFDSATNRLLFSENAGAYVRVGNVTGPAGSTDEALARFDAATGRILQNSAITLSDAGALTFPDDIRQTFNPGANNAGLNVGALAGDPATPSNGDLWYDSAGNLLRARVNGVTFTVGNVTGPAAATDEALARFDLATGKVIQNSAITLSDAGALTFPDDVRQTFNPGVNNAGLNVGALAGDPAAPINGDLWYDSANNLLRGRINGASVNIGTSLAGGINTEVQFNNAGALGGVTGITSDGTNVTAGSGNLRATSPRITTAILDANGNEIINLSPVAVAVNQVEVVNAIAGSPVIVRASGDDADIDLNLDAKGTGRVVIKGYAFTLEVNTTPTGNVGAGLDTLHSFSIPANSLENDGDYLQVYYGGLFATNDNQKRVVIQLDGQTVFDSGLQDFDGLADRNQWVLQTTIVRVSGTTVNAIVQVIMGQFFADGAGTFVSTNGMVRGETAIGLVVADLNANAVTLNVAAEATANNDVVQDVSVIELVQR